MARRKKRWAENPELYEEFKRKGRERYHKKRRAMTPEEKEAAQAGYREYRRQWEKTPGGKKHLREKHKKVRERRAAWTPEQRLADSRKRHEVRKADPVRYALWKKRCAESVARCKKRRAKKD